MPPKQRTGSVSKQCEECGGSNPVACKVCTACGADFYASNIDKANSPGEASNASDTSCPTERRRSERVKREKPDYYDALEFDHKRKPSTPTSRGKRDKHLAGRSPRVRVDDDTESGSSRGGHRHHRGSKHQGPGGRATLTWKKGQEDDDVDKEKKKRKRKREDTEDELLHIMDELPSEKTLQCQVALAEINRKLCGVVQQPV